MEGNPLYEVGDAASVAVIIGALSEVLPPIAALLAIIWTGIRIYEWARVRLFNKPRDYIIK